MKNNRLLSFILCFTLVFTLLFSAFPVYDAYASTIELYEEDYENAGAVLKAISPAFPLSQGESTTRADFVAAVTMMLGCEESTNTQTGFSDVPAEHKYSGNIKFAKDFGLISSAETFSPDAPVTYVQAIKILMCATGHSKKAEYLGGYPTGYLTVAAETSVGESNKQLSTESALTHKDATELILDAVCTDMLDTTAFGGDSFEYAEIEGKNILSVYHKIYIAEGIVDANKSTGLYSASAGLDNEGVSVNGKEYSGEGYNGLLGKRARIFFKEDGKRHIVYAYPVANKLQSFSHDDDLILSGTKLNAFVDGADKEENYTMESDYTVIYNGKYYAAAENTYNACINPDAGNVEFVDNDNNGKFDVIMVKDIEYGVIGSINIFEKKIYDKYKSNAMRNLSDDIDYYIAGSDGESLQLEDLNENDVVGYAVSKDGKSVEIIRYTGKTGGTYTELGDNVMNLGQDKNVVLSKYFTDNIKLLDDLKLGTKIIAYLGIGNQVVYIEEYSNTINYGYLADFAIVGTGIGTHPCARIYTQDGELLEINLAEKVYYNGRSVSQSDATELLNALKAQPHVMKVIKYAVNTDGELSKIYETVQNTEGAAVMMGTVSAEASPVLFDTNLDLSDPLREIEFKYNTFFPYFTLKSGAPIMQVPLADEDADDERNYRIYSLSELSARSSNEQYGYFYGYDVTQNGAAFLLWISDESGGVAAVNEFTSSGVVESITTGADSEGNIVKVLRVYIDKAWKKLYAPSEYTDAQASLKTTIDTIRPGDIVRFETDSKNVISACRIDFSYENGKTLYKEGTGSKHAQPEGGGKYIGFAVGYVYTTADGKATIIRNKATIEEIENDLNSGTLSSSNLYPVNISSGTTVFVDMKRDRNNPDKFVSADVYTEPNVNAVESYFSAGRDADFVVSRARLHAININVIYVN